MLENIHNTTDQNMIVTLSKLTYYVKHITSWVICFLSYIEFHALSILA